VLPPGERLGPRGVLDLSTEGWAFALVKPPGAEGGAGENSAPRVIDQATTGDQRDGPSIQAILGWAGGRTEKCAGVHGISEAGAQTGPRARGAARR